MQTVPLFSGGYSIFIFFLIWGFGFGFVFFFFSLRKCYVIGHKVESELMLLFTCGYLHFDMTISDFKPRPAEYLKRSISSIRCKWFRKEQKFWNRWWLLKSSCKTIDISQQEPLVNCRKQNLSQKCTIVQQYHSTVHVWPYFGR